MYNRTMGNLPELTDHGGEPFVVNIERATLLNRNYRTALWTGQYLQLTLMSIKPGEDIGLEMHPGTDQFLRIEQGQGVVKMGPAQNNLTMVRPVGPANAILVPAGTWHNIINTGRIPLQIYTVYAPPHHPFGIVQPIRPGS